METQRDAGADHDDVKPEEKVADDDAEKKENQELSEEQQLEKANLPDTVVYEEGSDGPVATSAGQSDGSLVRSDAFLEEDETDLIEQSIACKKCGQFLELEDSVVRGPRELWCKECHAIYTMLRRHQKWPPKLF